MDSANGGIGPGSRRGLPLRGRKAACHRRRPARPPARPRHARRSRDRATWSSSWVRTRTADRSRRSPGATETRVVNPAPERGLSSSLTTGFDAIPADADAVLVALGDQPLVPVETIRALLAAASTQDRPVVVPVFEEGQGRNPVLLRRPAFGLVAETSGDRGLGPVLAAHPELVTEVAATGDNPDVDTIDDLAAVLESAWATRVRENREQVERIREVPDGQDFYAPVTSLFRADPTRTGDAGARRPARPRPVRRHVARRRCRRRPVRAAARPRARPVGRVGGRSRHVALDARGPARDRRGLRHRERPRRRGALAAGRPRGRRRVRGGRRAHRPRRLRHRGDRAVPASAGGRRRSPVRRRAHGARPGIGRGPVLAAGPRRGARGSSGVARGGRDARGARASDRRSSASRSMPAGSSRAMRSRGSSGASSGSTPLARRRRRFQAALDELAVPDGDGWTIKGRGPSDVGIVTWAPR